MYGALKAQWHPSSTGILTPLKGVGWPALDLNCVSLGQCGHHQRICGYLFQVVEVLLRKAADAGLASIRSSRSGPQSP